MLSSDELTKRRSFYGRIFGLDVIDKTPFKPTLWPVENYDKKIRGLAKRRFKNPHKIIITMPTILGYSFEKIDSKIKGLKERGFKNAHNMISSSPQILCFSIKNIDRKLKLCRRLGVDVDAYLANSVVFIGMSSKHYVPLLRACRRLGKEPIPRNVFRIYIKSGSGIHSLDPSGNINGVFLTFVIN